MSGIDAQRDIDLAPRLRRQRIDDVQLLDGFAVDSHDTLFDCVANLLVALAHAGIDDIRGCESRLYRTANLVAARAVDAMP